MSDTSDTAGAEGTNPHALQPETSATAAEQARLRDYLDQAIGLEDGLEAAVNLVTGKLAQTLLALQADLEAVRDSLPDPQERLAVDLESSEPLYKISKAVNEQSQLLLRLRRHRERIHPATNDQSNRSLAGDKVPRKKRRAK